MSGARADEALDATYDEGYGLFVARAAPLGPPSDADLELIRGHVQDPAVLEEAELVTWLVTASNTNLDAYFTRQDPETSLRNYAQDAVDGLAFMDSHHTGGMSMGPPEQPLGHSFDGRFVGPSGAGPARVEERFYAFRGQEPNGRNKLTVDQLVFNMRAGTSRDISIGFMPGWYRCNIDGLNWLRDMACRHWPGFEYPKLNAKGEETGEQQLAYLWVMDAHQTEASAVYDGATPGCMVGKARRLAAAGEIRADVVDLLEQRYRITLPRPARAFGGADIPAPPKEERMDPIELTPEQVSQIRLALVAAGRAPDEDLVASIVATAEEARAGRASATEVERLKPFEAEVTRLRPLADEGTKYRADEVARAIAEGKRAMGAEFAEETYRGLLEAAPLETVQRMAADWKAIGDKQFPGGRLTQDPPEPTPIETGKRRAAPMSAYRG